MGLFRRLAGLLGLNKDDSDDSKDDDYQDDAVSPPAPVPQHYGPRRGFSVPVQVAVDRPTVVPVLVPCASGDGGVQGVRWFAKRLRTDKDGDVADEFLDEIAPEGSLNSRDQHKPWPMFEINYSTKPANVRDPIRYVDGHIQLEPQGRIQ